MSEKTAFLGVERSLSGKFWRLREADDRIALAIAQRHGIPEPLGRVLAARGVDLEHAAQFLDPKLRQALPDPVQFKDMDIGAERLAAAVLAGEQVAVFGDYDVDGATSSALVGRYFDAVGGRCRLYIPDRVTEGYGPNLPALMRLKEEGASVVLTVDCGITAHDVLGTATEAGLDVIVVDHHGAEITLPKALAVINPNRLDEDRRFGHLAAVGVAFLLLVAVNRALRTAGHFEHRPEPDLLALLDLVALGTICDVVPLRGLNRAFVRQGLKVMGQRRNRGLNALADVAGVKDRPGTYHAGFLLGPRVNAGGRVGRADLGARLLATDDPLLAKDIARQLDDLNKERRDVEAAVLAQAIDQAEASEDPYLTLVAGEGWHPGVVGIVAGRLVERYNRPACVIGLSEGHGAGSGRSIPGVDLGAAVIAARQTGLLTKGGGHPMAAGFALPQERLEDFRAFLSERFGRGQPGDGFAPELKLDGALSVEAATYDFITVLERAAPFGAGNAEPRFVLPEVLIGRPSVVGEEHLRCYLSAAGGKSLKAIAFRSLETNLGQALLGHGGKAFHVAGRLRVDEWRGAQGVQFLMDDAAPCGNVANGSSHPL